MPSNTPLQDLDLAQIERLLPDFCSNKERFFLLLSHEVGSSQLKYQIVAGNTEASAVGNYNSLQTYQDFLQSAPLVLNRKLQPDSREFSFVSTDVHYLYGIPLGMYISPKLILFIGDTEQPSFEIAHLYESFLYDSGFQVLKKFIQTLPIHFTLHKLATIGDTNELVLEFANYLALWLHPVHLRLNSSDTGWHTIPYFYQESIQNTCEISFSIKLGNTSYDFAYTLPSYHNPVTNQPDDIAQSDRFRIRQRLLQDVIPPLLEMLWSRREELPGRADFVLPQINQDILINIERLQKLQKTYSEKSNPSISRGGEQPSVKSSPTAQSSSNDGYSDCFYWDKNNKIWIIRFQGQDIRGITPTLAGYSAIWYILRLQPRQQQENPFLIQTFLDSDKCPATSYITKQKNEDKKLTNEEWNKRKQEANTARRDKIKEFKEHEAKITPLMLMPMRETLKREKIEGVMFYCYEIERHFRVYYGQSDQKIIHSQFEKLKTAYKTYFGQPYREPKELYTDDQHAEYEERNKTVKGKIRKIIKKALSDLQENPANKDLADYLLSTLIISKTRRFKPFSFQPELADRPEWRTTSWFT